MAIVTCPDCKRELSDSAISCPNCGYPYEKNLNLYLQASRLMKDAKSAESMLGVAEIFCGIKEFRDSEALMESCKAKANELPQTNYCATPNSGTKEENKPTFLYAILLTICGVVIAWSSFADGYFHYSFANSSLSGGTRYYDSSFPALIGELPIGDLIILAILAFVLLGILLAWIAAVKNKHLEIYCVITASVVFTMILVCSIIGPIVFTDHNDFGFGYYSYMDFESFGSTYYIQIASSIGFLAISIINRVKSFKK